MRVPKIVGLEQEYAIIVDGRPDFNPIDASFDVVNAYGKRVSTIWDYDEESPLLDARGFVRKGEMFRLSRRENYRINNLLTNGARLYVDHAHPEYSTAEASSALEAVALDKAGERILDEARVRASREEGSPGKILIYKNNSDGKGNSYGCHENYLMSAEGYKKIFPEYPAAPTLASGILAPFLVTRQIYCGAGKVGVENGAPDVEYQISQRADFFETVIDGNTTCNRPIINSRDEPHADRDRFRRLHIIIGDSNLSEYSGFLKLGTTQIILAMIEDGHVEFDLSLEDPVRAVVEISHDQTCKKKVEMENGQYYTPIEIQREFLDQAERYCQALSEPVVPDQELILRLWREALDGLSVDPEGLRDRVDWVIKRWILRRTMRKRAVDWTHPILQKADIGYHDIRRERGLYYLMEREGHVQRLLEPSTIEHFGTHAPEGTRAYFRSRCLQRFGGSVSEANWNVLVFEPEKSGGASRKIFLQDPTKGTRDLVEPLLNEVQNVNELISAIAG